MKLIYLLIAVCLLSAVSVSAQDSKYSQLESDILKEINRVRANPQAYAKWIEDNRAKLPYTPEPPRLNVIDEAIRALKSAVPLPQLSASPLAYKAAKAHLDEQLPTGQYSHTSKNGDSINDRLKKVGKLTGAYSENAALMNPENPLTAERVVLLWIIDDLVSNRGHRKNLLNKNYLVTGIACGKFPDSKVYKDYAVCVANFAAQLS